MEPNNKLALFKLCECKNIQNEILTQHVPILYDTKPVRPEYCECI